MTKTPIGSEEIGAIQYVSSLFNKEEGVNIVGDILELIGYLLFGVRGSDEPEAVCLISEHMKFLLPRLAVFRDFIEVTLVNEDSKSKAKVPQTLYMLSGKFDCLFFLLCQVLLKDRISTWQKSNHESKLVYTIINIIGSFLESNSKYFCSEIENNSPKSSQYFHLVDECLKLIVQTYSSCLEMVHNLSNTSPLDIYSNSSMIIMAFFCAFTLKLPMTRKIDVVTTVIPRLFEKNCPDVINPNIEESLHSHQSPSILLLFSHAFRLDHFFKIISYETSTVGIKLVASIERTKNLLHYFALYFKASTSIGLENTNKVDFGFSKMLCKIMLEILATYVSSKGVAKMEGWRTDYFTQVLIELFDCKPYMDSIRGSLQKLYSLVVEWTHISVNLLKNMVNLPSHPILYFLEILEKKPKEDGVTFTIKYNCLMMLDSTLQHIKNIATSDQVENGLDIMATFCKTHNMIQRLCALIKTEETNPELSEEARMTLLTYFEILLESILKLILTFERHDPYIMDTIVLCNLPMKTCFLLQNNQKQIIKQQPKLWTAIFKLFEVSIQIFVAYSRKNPDNQKLTEIRDKLFAKAFIYIIRIVFQKLNTENRERLVWNRGDDPERCLANSVINVLYECALAATNTTFPIISSLFKEYLNLLREHNVHESIQNLELPTPNQNNKIKQIVMRISPESKTLDKYGSFAKPANTSTPSKPTSSTISQPPRTTPPAKPAEFKPPPRRQ